MHPHQAERQRWPVQRTEKLLSLWHVDPHGKPAIPHGSRVKIRLQHPGGYAVDRIPAWIPWATVAAGQMGAKYDGIYWDPPQHERYQW